MEKLQTYLVDSIFTPIQNPSENPASGKQLEYAIHMLAILAKNALHVVGFNLFNTIYQGHISPFGINS